MNAHTAPFAPRAHAAVSEPTMSCDIPNASVFLSQANQSWKAVLLACTDSAPATGEYKLLQLRQYLTGEALKMNENLGHSAFAYEAAKKCLEPNMEVSATKLLCT